MTIEKLTVLFGLFFLVSASFLMIRQIFRGRQLCEQFARRLPDEYLAHDEPRPAFFYSSRSAAYSAFVLQRKFEQLSDRRLVVQFEEVRRREVQTLVYLFVGFAVLGLAWFWIEVLGRA
jgi:hypothetical protein